MKPGIDDLIISIKGSLLHLIGILVFLLETDKNLRDTPCWNAELEKGFQENLCERFDISIDLNKINVLTIDNVTDVITDITSSRITNSERDPDSIPKSDVHLGLSNEGYGFCSI